jgi:hypothetical protein
MVQTANKRKSTLLELRKKEGFIIKNVIVVRPAYMQDLCANFSKYSDFHFNSYIFHFF